jgi:hypothetical protein
MKFTREDFRKASPKYKLVPHLERALAEFDDPWEYKYEPKKGDLGWHPSGDCMPPITSLYHSALDRLNETVPASRFSNKNGQVGHFWHQYLQHVLVHKVGFADDDAIERRGMKHWGGSPISSRWSEAFPPFHYATGAADVAPCVIPRHGEYVVDFKTMASNQYRQLTVPEWAALKYECQINIYMDFFDLEKGLIVAVNKDSPHELKEFEYRRNDKLVEFIYNKWKIVSECITHEEPPNGLDDNEHDIKVFYESLGD